MPTLTNVMQEEAVAEWRASKVKNGVEDVLEDASWDDADAQQEDRRHAAR